MMRPRPPMNRRRAISSASSNTSGGVSGRARAWVSGTCSSSSPTRTVRTPRRELSRAPTAGGRPEYFAESAIAQRARDAVDALGDDPVATVRRDAERALAVIAASPADAVIGSPMGSMALSAYLPSRSAELVIHGLDLARALTLPVAPPADAIIAALEWVGAVASRRKVAVDLLLAATGRAALPPGFSVY